MPAFTDPIPRFWAKVDIRGVGDCWEWRGTRIRNGYGRFTIRGVKVVAHRFAYEISVGLIPDGLQIDHLCGNKGCVNPHHLEAVTQSENLRRAFRMNPKSVCVRGHNPAPDDIFVSGGTRRCRSCCKENARAQAARRRAARAASKP